MNTFGFAAIIAGGLAAAGFLASAAPAAQAAPAGAGNAADTISALDSRGYQVRVTQQGMNKPLEESSIVSVRIDNDHRIVFVTTR